MQTIQIRQPALIDWQLFNNFKLILSFGILTDYWFIIKDSFASIYNNNNNYKNRFLINFYLTFIAQHKQYYIKWVSA